jgi:hypothetical protein
MFINTFPWRYPPLLSNIALKNPTEEFLPEIEILVTAGATPYLQLFKLW